jgi:hypothetical protein
LNALASQKPISDQDILSLNVLIIEVTEQRAYRIHAPSIGAFKPLLTEDTLVHVVYATLAIWSLIPSNRLDLKTLGMAAVGM